MDQAVDPSPLNQHTTTGDEEFLAWCHEHFFDPESTEVMVAYEVAL